MNTTEKIQRVTERGQITLPIAWRRKAGVNAIVVREKGEVLEISPLVTEDERDEQWVTVFDATRDNGGVGVPAEEMIVALKKLAKKKKSHGRTR